MLNNFHSVLLDEIYKRRTNKKIRFLAVFTCDEWRKTNVDRFYPSTYFCTQKDEDMIISERDLHDYDPDTNERIFREPLDVRVIKELPKDWIDTGTVGTEKHPDLYERMYRVGTYKSTIDEKGKLSPYKMRHRYGKREEMIINYDTDELKTYCEEQEKMEQEE